ncbi:MAG TPA: hypothetical protein VIH72_01785 [Candidatus Acidoferrales bacterium]
MRLKPRIAFIALLAIFAVPVIYAQNTQSTSAEALHVRHVVGMQDVKYDATGLLLIESNELHFDAGRSRAAISISSIEDIYVGSEITEGGGRLGELARGAAMAAPYDSGAALTLLMIQKVDVLTVTYRDSDNGLHAAIFALPKNQAEKFRADLINSGVHVKNAAKVSHIPRESPSAEPARPKSPPASAILVEPVDSGDVNIPAEFRLAIYEDIVKKLQASGIYARVFRSGDHRADGIADLVTLNTEVEKFKAGNQPEREIVTVLGATTVKLSVKLSTRDGAILLDKEVEGKVRFFGENLGVIHDAAKRITEMLRKTP